MVFNIFPEDPDLYNADIRPIVSSTIQKYGKKEWKAGILTTEIHGHLGIYAIIGVKMGLKSLEYLQAEAGDIRILSFAGRKPPISCLNDGLQVSTEATFGHGLIDSPQTDDPLPEAIVSTEKSSIRIRLNKQIRDKIKNEIAFARNKYGLGPEYWQYVRELAIQYWEELDRNEIFDITNE